MNFHLHYKHDDFIHNPSHWKEVDFVFSFKKEARMESVDKLFCSRTPM